MFRNLVITPTRGFHVSAGIKTIGVLGAGQMGTGIAIVSAQHMKARIMVVDTNQASLDRCNKFIATHLDKAHQRGKLTGDEVSQISARIESATSMDAFEQCDFIIEAASEDTTLKLNLFRSLDKIAPAHAILASNTSSISITKIAAATARPSQVIGMHFMNPVPVMSLVEIIPGIATSPETLETTKAVAARMGKTTTTSRDVPGFIANRILLPYINEAIQALYEGIGTVEDIDTTMKLGTNVPMGPLTLADFIGLDTCLAIMRVLHSQLGDSKYRPSPLLVQYVDAGWLGKKSGRGFYKY